LSISIIHLWCVCYAVTDSSTVTFVYPFHKVYKIGGCWGVLLVLPSVHFISEATVWILMKFDFGGLALRVVGSIWCWLITILSLHETEIDLKQHFPYMKLKLILKHRVLWHIIKTFFLYLMHFPKCALRITRDEQPVARGFVDTFL
jgi:hypothetical protein